MKTMKCGWCGQVVQVLPNGRVKPHRNGAQQCYGSGQPKAHHEMLREANKPKP